MSLRKAFEKINIFKMIAKAWEIEKSALNGWADNTAAKFVADAQAEQNPPRTTKPRSPT